MDGLREWPSPFGDTPYFPQRIVSFREGRNLCPDANEMGRHEDLGLNIELFPLLFVTLKFTDFL